MTAPGTRYERTDFDHMAKVRQVRAQRDRIDPLWAHKLLEGRRRGDTREGVAR